MPATTPVSQFVYITVGTSIYLSKDAKSQSYRKNKWTHLKKVEQTIESEANRK